MKSNPINMKKTYLKPNLKSETALASQMMAVSIQDGNADPDKPVLSKEDAGWEIWDDDEE